MSRLSAMSMVVPSGDNYGNKSLLNVDGNYYSKSKRKRLPLVIKPSFSVSRTADPNVADQVANPVRDRTGQRKGNWTYDGRLLRWGELVSV